MATSELDTNDILMAGCLCKRTKFTRKWKKFYWRLLSNGQLKRYKDIKQTKSLGQVDIKRNCYDIREGLDTTSKVTFPSYIPSSCCFSISFTDKSYYMYADTPASAKEWIRVFSNTSSIISRRRSETDARSRELERRRVALKNARQRRSRRNLPDTMSVDLVLECVEAGELEHLEDEYLTILPPSPSHPHNRTSTASLLRRSASVPDILNSNDNNNNSTTADSMTSLYDDNGEDAVPPPKPARVPADVAPPKPARVPAPTPPTRQTERRNSFSEDHPTLQRNTVLRETRKAHKGYFATPQVTSSTFKVRAAVDDIHLGTSVVQNKQPIDTATSPTLSESSTGVVNVSLQSNITSPMSPLTSSSYNRSPELQATSSAPIKLLSSRQKVIHQTSFPDYVTPVPDNSFVYPTSPQKPVTGFLTSGPSSPATKQLTSLQQIGTRQHSLPELSGPPADYKEEKFSPPVVKRFAKVHQRCKSLSELMPVKDDPDNQRRLHKALGGAMRPQSMAAQQAIIAELQITAKLT